jgi:phosphoglycolate phosphatase
VTHAAPSPLRAVLFDLDGTLVDTDAQMAAAVRDALGAHGFDCDDAHIRAMSGLPYLQYFQTGFGMTPQHAATVYAAYLEAYARDHIPVTPIMAGAVELLDLLASRGLALALVTTKREELAFAVLDTLGWRGRFPVVIGQQTAARTKPAPDPALLALERLRMPPNAAAFVGDTEYDMGCASAAGLAMAVGLTRIRTPEAMRAAGATHVCGTLAEAGAAILSAVAASRATDRAH